MLVGDLAHKLHSELVVIGGDVHDGVNGREFVLSGRDFVVTSLSQYAQFPQFFVEVRHEREYARTDAAEVVILEFLTFRRLGAEQRAPRENQILALKEKFFVDKEVFLLGSYRGDDLGGVFTEYREQSYRLIGQRLGGAEKRGFLVEDLTGVRAERGGNTQRAVLYERVASGIPRGVAARFERRAQAAVGETGRVGFALYEFLTGKTHNDRAPVGLMKLSCFSAVIPVIGWNQCV